MKDSIKYSFYILYLIIAFMVTIGDMGENYGVDGAVFWYLIRPFISVLKGLLWPITIWF